MDLSRRVYRTVSYVSGPLVFVEGARRFPYAAKVRIVQEDGRIKYGQVLEVSGDHAVIQVMEESKGIDVVATTVLLEEEMIRMAVGPDLIGRVFDGSGRPLDGHSPLVPRERPPIIGEPVNPVRRDLPSDFIQTGISSIDGFNTLVRGQKLPIFSGAGLPANRLADQILRQARVPGSGEAFAVVFAAMGITQREASFFLTSFRERGAMERVVVFLNLAGDPTIERLMTPRLALTAAEHLAFRQGMHVLVILTDMTNYCEALREVATAREEIPGRRGYPGYMYTDLASIYERAGRIKGRPGSVTQLPILTMPDDDITHPIPDLTGYITEGQIVLSRPLHRKNVYPPVDILPCLSRLMNQGIGPGKTREDHRQLANQLYACYAEGRDIRRLVAIVGEDALSDLDKRYFRFADRFEAEMIAQGDLDRGIVETLSLGWRLLRDIPPSELKRLTKDLITRYFSEVMEEGTTSPFY
jgi:V/A-type H+-transporting ATPase subunit B